jgi:thioredoxin
VANEELSYLSDGTYEEVLRQAEEPYVLLDFTADWCEPCLAMEPILEELSVEYSGQIRIVKVDLDDSPQITESFGVLSIPTFLLLEGGKQVARFRGAQTRRDLKRQLDDVLTAGSLGR